MDNPPPINWLALLSRGPFFPSTPSYLDPFLEPTPAPNGWLGLPQRPNAMATELKYAHAHGSVANALLAYPPQPPFDDPLDAAAWARTAGHVDAPSCRDEEGVPLLRNVRRHGEFGAWDKARVLDGALGGQYTPDNVRALNQSSNRSQGAHLGNALGILGRR